MQEEGSTAFAAAMEEIHLDMGEVAALFDEQDLGPVNVGLQDNILRRVDDLIGGFKDVIEQKSEGGGGQPPSGGGQPPPQLVPPIVELKLMRRLQMDLNQRMGGFLRRHADELGQGELDPAVRRRLERLAHQQARLKTEMQRLIDNTLGEGDGPPDGGDDEGAGTGSDNR